METVRSSFFRTFFLGIVCAAMILGLPFSSPAQNETEKQQTPRRSGYQEATDLDDDLELDRLEVIALQDGEGPPALSSVCLTLVLIFGSNL